MLYMSGPRDTLKELKEKEEYEGSLLKYEIAFIKANPHIVVNYPDYENQLPPYVPILLVTESMVDSEESFEMAREVCRLPLQTRQVLRQMQEEGHEDIVTQVALSDVMEEFQSYAKAFRESLKTPLILTPWQDLSSALTEKSLFKIFGESTSHAADMIKHSTPFKIVDTLYENMLKRDALNRQWYMLRGRQDKEARTLMQKLKQQIDQLTTQIRKLLPKKLDKARRKFSKKITETDIKNMRRRPATPRAAGKMILQTTNMDMLNRLGLNRLRFLVKYLKKLGQGINKGAKILNWGIVAYDTIDAYMNNEDVARTLFAGAASVVIASEVTAAVGGTTALGGLAIGTLVGDAAIGTTILICSPIIGWAVLLIAGVAVAGYITYKTKTAVEGVWDLAEDTSGKIIKETNEAVDWMHDMFEDGWTNKDPWIQEYYGDVPLSAHK